MVCRATRADQINYPILYDIFGPFRLFLFSLSDLTNDVTAACVPRSALDLDATATATIIYTYALASEFSDTIHLSSFGASNVLYQTIAYTYIYM